MDSRNDIAARPEAARLLTEKRGKLALDQRALAKYLGCSRSMVGMLETGRTRPSLTLGNRIEALLGIPAAAWDNPADLLPQDGSEPEPKEAT